MPFSLTSFNAALNLAKNSLSLPLSNANANPSLPSASSKKLMISLFFLSYPNPTELSTITTSTLPAFKFIIEPAIPSVGITLAPFIA